MRNDTKVIRVLLKGVQCYIVTNGTNAILVDTGNPGSEGAVLRKMSEIGLDASALSLILITHGHSDHMGSSGDLRKLTGAKVAIGAADSQAVQTGMNPKLTPTNMIGRIACLVIPKRIKGFTPYTPDLLIDTEMSLKPFGIDGTVLQTPGHTAGSLSVLLETGEMLAGDAIMGTGRKAAFPLFAEDAGRAAESIARIAGMSPAKIHVGHGGPFTAEDIGAISGTSSR